RSMHAVEEVYGYPFLLQRLEDFNHLAFGANHPHVAGSRLHRPAQNSHIIPMPSRNNDDVGRLIWIELVKRLFKIQGMYFASQREPFLRGIRGAIVSHDYIKARSRCCLTKTMGYVACTKNIK